MRNKLFIIIAVALVASLSGVLFISNQASAPAPAELDGEQYIGRIVGTWQSTSDEKAVVSYRVDGTVADQYDGEVLSEGVWEIYTDPEAAYNADGFFLRTTIGGEAYEYAILEATADTLQLNYLSRGNTLEYRRISE